MIKKFDEFDEERQEQYKEYEDFYGYPVGDIFLFSPYRSDDDPNGYNEFQILITPKSYYDDRKCHYDGRTKSLIDMPDGFGEASESDFEYDGNLKDAIKSLVDNGFKFSQKFQSFNESCSCSQAYGCLVIDGLSVSDYIMKNYPNSVV
jgi:hypothetical protein